MSYPYSSTRFGKSFKNISTLETLYPICHSKSILVVCFPHLCLLLVVHIPTRTKLRLITKTVPAKLVHSLPRIDELSPSFYTRTIIYDLGAHVQALHYGEKPVFAAI